MIIQRIDQLQICLCDHSDIELMALMEPDGTAHYSDGTEKNVSYRAYFQKALAGERALSEPLESSVNQNIRIVLAVPVQKDNRIIGVLAGSYDATSISQLLLNDLFDGEGYSLIVNTKGEIVGFDGTGAYRKLTYGDNFFTYCDEKLMAEAASLDKVRTDFARHHKGIILMQNPEEDSARQYMSYAPLGINGWMICYILPPEATGNLYKLNIATAEEQEIDRLPVNMGEAIKAMEADPFVLNVLGEEYSKCYLKAKKKEWDEYCRQVSQWEIDHYLYSC